MDLRFLINGLHRSLEGSGFDARFVSESVVDTGPQAARALGIAARLNGVRAGLDKQPVILWNLQEHAALTVRGRFIYVAMPLAQRLSDNGLAFVLAHEMAHHDLGHVSDPLRALASLPFRQEAELDADREALKTTRASGFDPRGGLEALSPVLFEEEAPPPKRSRLDPRRWIDGFSRSHPPTAERLAAIEHWLATKP